MKKRISVIVPSYQHGFCIADCLTSLLKQTRKPDEIIVVDDGSTDNTQERLSSFSQQIISLRQDNHGAPHARMTGFDRSSGEYILFCDADIMASPKALEKLEHTLEMNPVASYSYANFFWGYKRFPSHAFDARTLREQNYIHSTSLIRREYFPGFDVSLKRFQDWDLWLTMLERGYIGVWVDEYLFRVQNSRGRKGISTWLPSCVYKIPWPIFGWTPKAVKSYEEAKKVIMNKHV